MLKRFTLTALFALLSLFGWSPSRATAYGPDHYFERPADKEMAVAVAAGDTRTMERLVRSGEVNVLTVGRDATSWLVIAIAARQKNALDLLLDLGGLGDPKGKIAGQALYTAMMVGTKSIFADLYWLKRLHEAGADLNNYGGGNLLLEVAANTHNRQVLDFFLEHGADIDKPTLLAGSVAQSEASIRRFDLANEFLDRGASPWAMDAMGSTLGYAAEKAARVPTWDRHSKMEKERQRLLDRLHALGFPDPAPTPDEAYALRQAGKWPPARNQQ